MKAFVLSPVLLVGALTLCQASQAQSSHAASGSPLLLVANQGDADVSFVDPKTAREITTLAEGVPSYVGHELAVSPDGRYAYVPLYGDSGVGRPGTDGRIMLVVDLKSRTIADRIDFGHGVRPHCVLVNPHDGLLYITTELDKTITVIDPKTRKIVGSIPTGQEQSHMLVLSLDGRRGYTANVGPGTVSVLDLAKRTFVTAIPISKNTQRIAISNDDRLVFTADQTTPQLAVIDTATNTLRQWIPLPGRGYGTVPTRDGRFLLVTLPDSGELGIVSLDSMKLVQTVKVGTRPQEVILSKDGATAYVSCYGGGVVAAVKVPSWTLQSTIKVGRLADGMAWVEKIAE